MLHPQSFALIFRRNRLIKPCSRKNLVAGVGDPGAHEKAHGEATLPFANPCTAGVTDPGYRCLPTDSAEMPIFSCQIDSRYFFIIRPPRLDIQLLRLKIP